MKKFGIIAAAFFLPGFAFAAIANVWDIFGFIQDVIKTALPLVVAAAVLYFIWGIFRFVMAGDEEAKKVAKDKIVFGIIGLFVMVSVWGLVSILTGTFGLKESAPDNVQIKNQLPTITIPTPAPKP